MMDSIESVIILVNVFFTALISTAVFIVSILNRNTKLSEELDAIRQKATRQQVDLDRLILKYEHLEVYTRKIVLAYKKLSAEYKRLLEIYNNTGSNTDG